MKRINFISIFAAVSFLCVPSLVSATEFAGDLLSEPHRVFEIGVNSQAMFANNALGLEDVLVKNVTLDFQQIADNISGSGFKFGFNTTERAFINLNISSRFRFSVFNELESNSRFTISEEFFDILASGLRIGQSKSVDVLGYSDAFYNIGFSFQTLVRGYGVKITPTYSVPLLYVPKTTATAKVTTNSSGLIKTEAESNIDIYTAINMKGYIEDGEKSQDFDTAEVLSNGGFDLSFEIERNWMPGLNAGLYTRIPIVPGKLDYKMSTKVWANFYEENLLGYLDDTEVHDKDYGHDDFVYTEDSYKAYRPLKLGLNATYMPFGKWFKIQPSLGFAVRNPYTSDSVFYPEYALDLNFSVLRRFFNLNLGTAYQNQVFQQRLGIGLNIRAIEIIAQTSLCGTSFMSTFNTRGYGAFVGARIGF